MKRLMFETSLVLLSIASAFISHTPAQSPLTPQEFWSAPDSSEIKTYTSSSIHNFRVDFVGTPAVDEGRGAISNYVARLPRSLMSVRVIQFSKSELEKLSSSEILAQVRVAYGTSVGHKILETFKDEKSAIDFLSSNGTTLRRLHALVIGDRLYEMYIELPQFRSLKDVHPDRLAAFSREADRFFNSFEITERTTR